MAIVLGVPNFRIFTVYMLCFWKVKVLSYKQINMVINAVLSNIKAAYRK